MYNKSNNKVGNVKDAAFTRIKETPVLKDELSHLLEMDWPQHHSTLKFLAEASLPEILENLFLFRYEQLLLNSHHQAGHAVIASLLGMDVTYAYSLPNMADELHGDVIIETDLYTFEQPDLNNNIWLWRFIVQFLAGPAAEEIFKKKSSNDYDVDVHISIDIIRKTNLGNNQENFLDKVMMGLSFLILDPSVQSAIKETAILLSYKGFLPQSTIDGIVAKYILGDPVRSPIIDIINHAVEIMAEIDKCPNRGYIEDARFLESIKNISSSFFEDLRNILPPDNLLPLPKGLIWQLHHPVYWTMDDPILIRALVSAVNYEYRRID